MLDFSRPEHLDDVAPPYAAALADCRARALAWLAAHDYALVVPPLADYIETLTGGDADLELQTFKMTDTLSKRTLGIRADQTPQIARFDASVADKPAQRRYCYCGPTLRTTPPQPWQGREAMQLGAELFGAPAGDGDWEIASVALGALRAGGIDDVCIDFGHAGLFAAAVEGLAAPLRERLTTLVARRDAAALVALTDSDAVPAASGARLLALAQTAASGAAVADALAAAQKTLPAAPLQTLDALTRRIAGEGYDCGFSLSELGSYGYHTGVVFNIYARDRLIARGGRYALNAGGGEGESESGSEGSDGVGFSVDLRAVCDLIAPSPPSPAVIVPLAPDDADWRAAVGALRAQRRRLRFVYAGDANAAPSLVRQGGEWRLQEAAEGKK